MRSPMLAKIQGTITIIVYNEQWPNFKVQMVHQCTMVQPKLKVHQ